MAWGLGHWREENRDKSTGKTLGIWLPVWKASHLTSSPKLGLDGQTLPSPILLPGIGLYLVQAEDSRGRNDSLLPLGGSHILIASFTYRPELDFQGHQSAFSAGIKGTFVVRQVTRHLPRSTGSLEAPACTA